MDADYANELELFENTPAQAEFLLHSLEQTAKSIGLYVNLYRTEFIWFKQDGAITTLNDRLHKLVDHFTYLGSNISSTEGDVEIAWKDSFNMLHELHGWHNRVSTCFQK